MKGMTEKPLPGSDVEEGGARGTCGSAAQGGACAHTGTRAHGDARTHGDARAHGDAIAPCGRLAEVCAGRTAGHTHSPATPMGSTRAFASRRPITVPFVLLYLCGHSRTSC